MSIVPTNTASRSGASRQSRSLQLTPPCTTWRPMVGFLEAIRGGARDALSSQTAAVPSTQIAEPREQRGRIWRSSCVIGRPAYVVSKAPFLEFLESIEKRP